MRVIVCAIVVGTSLASPACAQPDRAAAAFWKNVQATCDATAAKPAGELGRRIAQNAIDEFSLFGGHQIDANGRLFHFGLTEAEHREEDGGGQPSSVGELGWWRVLKYWRVLYGDATADKLEVLGFRDASASTQGTEAAGLLRARAADLLKAADSASDPAAREIQREAALRAAIIDTPWSAAFVSYVVRQAGVTPDAFQFSNAHRAYIYDAFATSAAEIKKETDGHAYRACPLTTRPRAGDLLCQQREPTLASTSDEAVREHISAELSENTAERWVRRTHCEVVAYIDRPARNMYTIGGNVNQAVTARKLNLRKRDLKFSLAQKSDCGGTGNWTLPPPSAGMAPARGPSDNCSLNDKKWFVLLQLR
jgi:hypothetical protein